MTTKTRLLPALLFSLAAATAAPAQAQQFSNVIVFGDSLSDAGYYRPFLLSLGLPAGLVAQMGRFTTNPGPVWSELVAQRYGVTPGPSNAGGTIYAQGGARVALTPGITPPGQAERPISAQITEYLSAGGGAANPNALYAVWGGANDVFVNLGAFGAGQITAAQLQGNVLGAATAEVQQVGRLMAAGARYVVVFALPDIGATPQFQAAGPALAGQVTQLSAGYNTTLFSGLAGAGLRVIPVDVFSLFAEIRANPSAFGFTNITGFACTAFPPFTTPTTVSSLFCNPQTLVAANAADTYAFADAVHPSTRSHLIIAQFAESIIEAPAQYSLLAEAALRTREGHLRTITEGLTASRQEGIGRWTLFAAGDRGKFDIDTSMGVVGLRSTNKSGSIGAMTRISEGVTLGLALGRTESDGTFGGSAGGFSTKESVLSLFGAASCEWGLYATAVASIADLKFSDVQRNIILGAQTRTATSAPSGSNASLFASLGYDFRLGRFSAGPLVSVNAQRVEVNGFDEAGAGAAGLRIGPQSRRSQVLSVGARAAYDLGAFTPWIRVTRDNERQNGDRVVTATPLSLPTNNSFDIPAFNPTNEYTTAAVGVFGTFMQRIGVSLAYAKVSGRSGISQDAVSGMVSYRF